MAAAEGLVSKSDYARMRNRSPGAVSKWIETGKLKPPALVGAGRQAKVNVAEADRMLADTLDLGQQLAQPAPVLLTAAAAAAAPPAAAPAVPLELDDDRRRQLKARADREEADAAEAIRKARENDGQWLHREAAGRAWARVLTMVIGEFEGLVPELAERLAQLCRADEKDLTIVIRDAFRARRARIAQQAAEAVEAEPELEAEQP